MQRWAQYVTYINFLDTASCSALNMHMQQLNVAGNCQKTHNKLSVWKNCTCHAGSSFFYHIVYVVVVDAQEPYITIPHCIRGCGWRAGVICNHRVKRLCMGRLVTIFLVPLASTGNKNGDLVKKIYNSTATIAITRSILCTNAIVFCWWLSAWMDVTNNRMPPEVQRL